MASNQAGFSATSTPEETDRCLICLQELDSQHQNHARGPAAWSVTVCCSHPYHRQCMQRWLVRQAACPSCHFGAAAGDQVTHASIFNAEEQVLVHGGGGDAGGSKDAAATCGGKAAAATCGGKAGAAAPGDLAESVASARAVPPPGPSESVSPAFQNVPLVGDGWSPPGSRVGGSDFVGLGGCTARALAKLGVARSAQAASTLLNQAMPCYEAKCRWP